MSKAIYTIISRAEAIEQGLKYYFTGKPCKHGHISPRFSNKSYGCVECEKIYREQNNSNIVEYQKQYIKKRLDEDQNYYKKINKLYRDNRLKYSKQYYINNKQALFQRSKEWRQKNRTQVRLNCKKWRTKNPHKNAEYTRLYNTLLEQSIPIWYDDESIRILYKKRDWLNSFESGILFEVDHIIPINPKNESVCGLHWYHNLQILTRKENRIKSDNYQTDWESPYHCSSSCC